MNFNSEKQLLERLAARDTRAYEILLDRYETGLYRFFYYAHGNHQTAEDQSGETLFRFVAALCNNRNGNIQNIKAYLFGIARNIQIEHYRKKTLKHEPISSEQQACEKPSAFRQVSSRDELGHVLTIITEFGDPERQILLLRFMEDASYEEIAQIMKMPLNSVKSYIHRGRKKLRELLLKDDPSDQEVHK